MNLYIICQYINCVPTCICNFQILSLPNYAYYINAIYPLVVAALVYMYVIRGVKKWLELPNFAPNAVKNFWGRTPNPPLRHFNTILIQIAHEPNSLIKLNNIISPPP